MKASKSMNAIRGKDRVDGSGKSKKRGNKSNGPTWQE